MPSNSARRTQNPPAGFIYPVLPKPIGPSRWTNIVPAARPMLRFDGNSAHSSGYMWCVGGVQLQRRAWCCAFGVHWHACTGVQRGTAALASGRALGTRFPRAARWRRCVICRFQAGCLYFGGLIYEDAKDNNKLYCEY